MSSENPTVYSTEQGKICPGCDKPIKQCTCRKKPSPPGDGNVRVSRETKGRKGKGVPIIEGVGLIRNKAHCVFYLQKFAYL